MEPLSEQLAILGLSPDAPLHEAEAAYRDLIRVWHPDRFTSDPKLRAKAQEQTVQINRAMHAVREAFKKPRTALRRPPPAQPQRTDSTPTSKPQQPLAHQPLQSSQTLVIHQPFRASFLQAILGCAICYLGIFLVLHFSERAGAQTALGLVVAGYGFSSFIFAVTTLFFKTPIIGVNRSFLHILGNPGIPIQEVVGADVMLSRRGISLTISCSPEYVRQLPLLQRCSMRLRRLTRGHHFELNSTLLDHDPRHVIQMLNASNACNQLTNVEVTIARPWGRYTHAAATLCLAIAVVRCLTTADYEFMSLVPYLVLFALLRSASTIQTAVLDHPSRVCQP